jgi:HPt (histidine-containing phosphotransfer) domain-containing protein
MMPDIDGIETTKIIRTLSETLGDVYYMKLPIIALTANSVSGMRDMFLAQGLNDFIANPIDTVKLGALLERWLPESLMEMPYEVEITSDTNETIDIPELDTVSGIQMSGGTLKTYIAALTAYYHDAEDMLGTIPKAMAKRDWKLYTTCVHAMKSASLSVGAGELSALAYELEKAGQAENIEYINGETEGFLAKLSKIVKVIEEALGKINDNGVEVSEEELVQDLRLLKKSLENMDTITVDEITDRLTSSKQSREVQAQLEEIAENILVMEYDKAVEDITDILKHLELRGKRD